jgi:hypothetical protein
MVAMVPAHSAITVCQDSRISGSAAMAESSLCHSVIQSCASLRGSGMSDAALPRDVESLKPASLNPASLNPASLNPASLKLGPS